MNNKQNVHIFLSCHKVVSSEAIFDHRTLSNSLVSRSQRTRTVYIDKNYLSWSQAMPITCSIPAQWKTNFCNTVQSEWEWFLNSFTVQRFLPALYMHYFITVIHHLHVIGLWLAGHLLDEYNDAMFCVIKHIKNWSDDDDDDDDTQVVVIRGSGVQQQ